MAYLGLFRPHPRPLSQKERGESRPLLLLWIACDLRNISCKPVPVVAQLLCQVASSKISHGYGFRPSYPKTPRTLPAIGYTKHFGDAGHTKAASPKKTLQKPQGGLEIHFRQVLKRLLDGLFRVTVILQITAEIGFVRAEVKVSMP